LSVALADKVTDDPDIVEPDVGAITDTTGGTLSTFCTFTLTTDEIPELPAAS
jgi:hypothetical protein